MTDDRTGQSVQTTLNGVVKATQVGHTNKDETDVYAGRGRGNAHLKNTSVGQRGWLGNPFPGDEYGHEESLERYRDAFVARLESDDEFRDAVRELHGTVLGCWCQRVDEDSPSCHAEIIAEYADRLAAGEDVFE